MKIIINGNETILADDVLTVADMLMSLNIPKAGTAVALNDKVVPKAEHENVKLSENDRIEIVRAVAGG